MTERRTIEIDADVGERIEAARQDMNEDANAILRRILGIDAGYGRKGGPVVPGAWERKGVTLLPGTELRIRGEEQVHHGFVRDGALWFAGRSFDSPSRAASYLGGGAVNGWRVIEARPRSWQRWVSLETLRGG